MQKKVNNWAFLYVSWAEKTQVKGWKQALCWEWRSCNNPASTGSTGSAPPGKHGGDTSPRAPLGKEAMD